MLWKKGFVKCFVVFFVGHYIIHVPMLRTAFYGITSTFTRKMKSSGEPVEWRTTVPPCCAL
jgi:hypothetical protein